ncbi:unnamed protein product [Schistosoma margrebowiei]|uniref:Uncharacterized protein n=1 Tax=Schistosoma margrebowiei TaxID=48269 RepID=A0A183N8L6_9TREM|nr:unnamed protein product [Schistosoma margrebowiei]
MHKMSCFKHVVSGRIKVYFCAIIVVNTFRVIIHNLRNTHSAD